MSPGLKGVLTEEGDILRLQTPSRFWLMRGLVLLLVVPALLMLLVGLLALLELLDTGEPGPLTFGSAVVLGLLCLPSAAVGAVHLLRAGPRSAASRVEIDLAARQIRPTEGAAVPLDRVRSLVLHKPQPLLKWLAIEAEVGEPVAETGNPYQPPRGSRLRLLGEISEFDSGRAFRFTEELAGRLGVPAEDRSPSLLGGGGASGKGKGRLGHALAYLPFQGIFLIASIFLLVARRDDPVARFHAKQSLVMFPLEMLAIFGAFALSMPFLFLGELTGSGSNEPHPVGIAIVLVLVIGVALGRLGLRLMAMSKAWRGEAWVIPIVGLISRRWKPLE